MIWFPKKSEKKLSWIITISVYGLKIIGLAPFSQRTETSLKNSRATYEARGFYLSKIGLVYNILFLFVMQIMDAFALPTFFSLSYPNSSSVTRVIDVAQGISCSFATYVVIISWTFRQKKAVCVLNRLLEIHRLLCKVEKQHSSNKGVLIFFTVHMIFSACIWITSRTAGALLVSGTLIWIFYSISHFVVYWFIVEYFFIVGFLAEAFKRVNQNLLQLQEFPNHLPFTPFFSDYLTVLSFPTNSQIAALKLLLMIRTLLYEVSRDITDFFSFPILFAIGYFSFLLVYNVYYLICILLVSSDEPSLISFSNGIAWILTVVYPLTLLSLNVTKTLKEAKRTGWIVHKLLDITMIQEIRVQLKQFSLQLLHERFRFTAYGFFELDCTLLQSILEATAMYNVILFQFSQPSASTSKHT